MRKTIGAILVISGLAGLAFYGQAKLHLFVKPCAQPITYSLDGFDNRFGISQDDFIKNVDKAVNIWEQPISKDLFKHDPNGKLKINLVYDYRQEATDKLKKLGLTIDNTQASYNSLKSRYEQMTADYNKLKDSLDQQVKTFDTQKSTYEQQVKYWNDQGGAPKNTADQLNARRDQLNKQADKINADQKVLNDLGDNINSVVDVINRMANNLNLNVKDYNNIGSSRGQEFEEGAYISAGGRQEIDIYEFESSERLTRVLAHELGHALGLEHIDSDPNAIMYYLNQGNTEKAAEDDVIAVKKLCGLGD